MAEIILASTSPARRALMDALGIAYRAIAPDFEEHMDHARDPLALTRELALGKARSIAARFPNAWVIGADQVCFFEGEIWGKPHDLADAREKLKRLSGKTHALICGVALIGPKLERVECDRVDLTLYPLTSSEIEAYLATGEWQGCAGGYRIEARGQILFSQIDGDRTSIRGLPTLRVVRMLRESGPPLRAA